MGAAGAASFQGTGMSRASCPVCRATNRCAFLCPNCINKVFARDGGQTPIDQLRNQRNELLDSLDEKLLHREVSRSQQIRRWQQLQELREARAKAQRAKAALATAQQQLAQLAAANSSRRHTLEQLSHQTAAARAEVLGNTLPTVLRYQSLTLSHVSAMLAREQRTRLRELTDIFPLRINALRDCGGPIQITVCNVRLPEGGSTPAGGWPEPQATSAALGYLLLFVDQVALIMGGPVLHESAHQASTSSIWQPSSFWNRQPASPAAMLPLNVMTAGVGSGSGTGQAAYNSTTSRYLSTATFWPGLPRSDSSGPGSAASLAAGTAAAAAAAAYAGAAYAASAISRAAGVDGMAPVGPGAYMLSSSPAAAQAAGASVGQQQGSGIPSSSGGSAGSSSGNGSSPGSGGRGSSSRRESDFKAAWDLLQRSLACFLKDKAAKNGMQLPNAWNPLAWLVVYCAVVKRDSRQDGKLVAASSRADATAAAVAAAAGQAAVAGAEGLGSMHDGCLSGGSLFGVARPSGAVRVGPRGGAAAGAAGGGGQGWPGFDEDDEDEEDEGWGVVQAPFLPPPPSQPDAVEHWARAMFDQRGGAAAQPYYAAGGVAAARGLGAAALGSSPGSGTGGMMSVERVRSMFGRGE